MQILFTVDALLNLGKLFQDIKEFGLENLDKIIESQFNVNNKFKKNKPINKKFKFIDHLKIHAFLKKIIKRIQIKLVNKIFKLNIFSDNNLINDTNGRVHPHRPAGSV